MHFAVEHAIGVIFCINMSYKKYISPFLPHPSSNVPITLHIFVLQMHASPLLR